MSKIKWYWGEAYNPRAEGTALGTKEMKRIHFENRSSKKVHQSCDKFYIADFQNKQLVLWEFYLFISFISYFKVQSTRLTHHPEKTYQNVFSYCTVFPESSCWLPDPLQDSNQPTYFKAVFICSISEHGNFLFCVIHWLFLAFPSFACIYNERLFHCLSDTKLAQQCCLMWLQSVPTWNAQLLPRDTLHAAALKVETQILGRKAAMCHQCAWWNSSVPDCSQTGALLTQLVKAKEAKENTTLLYRY